MPLEIRGIAVMDPAGRGVRFAGYPVGRRPEALVICEVTGETLRYLGNDAQADKDELLGIFETHKEAIFLVASKRYDEGHHRPRVTISDFATAQS